MRFGFTLSFFAMMIALCLVLPVASSGSRPANRPEDQIERNDEQLANTLCRATFAPHSMSRSPMLAQLLGFDPGFSVLSLEKWIGFVGSRSANSAPAPSTSRNGPDGNSLTPAQIIDVMVGPSGELTFQPSVVNINVGDTVRWTFATTGHNVVSGSSCIADNRFCSPNDTGCAGTGSSGAGAVYTHTFNTAGNFPYFCSPHCFSGMTGTVIVGAAPTPTPTP